MALRTGNPALKPDTFSNYSTYVDNAGSDQVMTINGVVNRTALLLLFTVGLAGVTWKLAFEQSELLFPLMIGGSLGAFVVGLVTIFKKQWAPQTALLYACLEGLALGGISAVFEARYPGIVMQAVSMTFGTMFCLLAAYRSGLIKATENFKLGVVAATGGICVAYLMSMVLGMFGIHMLHSTGPMSILISLFVVVVAALNLVLDFDFIEAGVDARAPKFMEWYAAFSLMVTLIWLYLELLRLLSKTRSRD